MTIVNDSAGTDAELKARHRAMWAMGDYPTVATELIPNLGAVLVEACHVQGGDMVLDVACGSGNAAIPAARQGANVTACDLTPALLQFGQRLAASQEVKICWQEADAESLPFEDGEFDVVLSCLGVMFAPHHQACADELVRVCRPGGTIGLVSWTPEGFVGQMFAVMRPYSPPPPTGTQPPPLWGNEDHVRALLGNRVIDVASPLARLSPWTGSRRPRHSGTTSRRTTGRRSPPTAVSPTSHNASRRSTRISANSPAATTMVSAPRSWTGNTLLLTARRAT